MWRADPAEFVISPRACARLPGDATEPATNGYLLALGRSCGVVFSDG